MGIMIGGLVLLVIFNLVLFCKWKQIKIAIAVVDATADFFVATKRINLVGIMYFILMAIWFVFWIACVIAMSGVGKYKWLGKGTNTNQERARDYPVDDKGKRVQTKEDYMVDFMIFSCLWVVIWLKDSNVFVLMASVSTYYFDSGPSGEGSAQVKLALKWAHTTHTGSIAFGSLIQTLLTLTVYPIMKYADACADSSNPGVRAQGICLKACLKCIEDMVEYLNKVAYAYMAITGNKYCSSAWNGFLLNIKHICQFYLTIQLAEGFISLGVALIMLCNIAIFTGLHLFIFNDMEYPEIYNTPATIADADACTALYEAKKQWDLALGKSGERIMGSVLAYLMIIVITRIIIEVFLGLFDEAIVSTLHCMAMDMELNGGRPKYGPPSFHEKMNEVLGNPDLDTGAPKDPE